MKRFVIWVVLAASLSFNVLFLVAFGIARQEAGRALTPEGSARLLARRLDLTDEQRKAYVEYRHRLQERRQAVANRYSDRTEAFWKLMAAPAATGDDAVGPMIEAAQEGRIELIEFETRELQAFLETLDPEQRLEYIALARKWMQRTFGTSLPRQ